MLHSLNLFLKSIILLSLLFVVDQGVGVIFHYFRDYALDNANVKPVTHHTIKKVDADILIMGNSRASHHYISSMLSDSLHLSAYNCGFDGQPFEYTVAMIHSVLKRYSPKVIIIDFEPTQFGTKEDHRFDLSELYPYYSEDSLIRKMILDSDPTNRIKMISNIYQNNSKVIDLLKLFISNYEIDGGYAPLPVRGYRYPNLINVKYDLPDTVNMNNIELVNNCIKMCKENQVQIIFSISPRYQKSNMSDLASMGAISKILQKENIPLIDWKDDSLVSDSTLYKDGAHLNHHGATVFTSQIISDLQQIL